jgi:hypothetical protein
VAECWPCATNEAASLVAACPTVWEVAFFDLEVAASLVDVAAASLEDVASVSLWDLPAAAAPAWET